jgi:capsular polysaccharide biosynthesis protein
LSSEAYYHWLLEDLPAYLRVKKTFPDSITGIRTASPQYVRDVLVLLGEGSIELPLYTKVQSLGMSKKSTALEPHRDDIALLEELRDAFRDHIPDADRNETLSKIYLSRRESGRYPSNEDAIEELMHNSGFAIVHLAGMSFLDQVNLFDQAVEIVGTHGAGFANLAWTQKNSTRVTEIARESQPDCFERIAHIKNLEYHRVDSPDTGEWVVDVAALAQAMNVTER